MITLKRVFVLSLILFGFTFVACTDDDEDDELVGNWKERSSFDGPARSSATSFVIDNYAYVVTGYTGDEYLNDLWVYDSEKDYWEQKADFIGDKRSSASAFALDSKGYVGLGYDGSNRLNDFYQYDPSTNLWEKKGNFAGSARYGAVGFAVAEKGYFGTGYDGNYLKDFYQYFPATDSWVVVTGFGGNKRRNGTVFVIDDKAYFGTGTSNNVLQYDFWEFDGNTEVWTKKRDIDSGDSGEYNEAYSLLRANASSFVINNLGYLVTGDNSKTVWQYNPVNDYWIQKTSLEASGRLDAIAFTINNRGFVMSGRLGTSYFDDLLEFFPKETQVDND